MFNKIPSDQFHFQQKIQRQYNCAKGDKIVLVKDFFDCAVRPAMEQNKTWKSIYGRDPRKLEESIQTETFKNNRPAFVVSYDDFKKDAQDREKDRIKSEIDTIMQKGNIKILKDVTDLFGKHTENPMIEEEESEEYKEAIRGQLEAIFLRDSCGIALYYADILSAMRAQKNWLGTDGITRYEMKSLKRSEGATALEFWERANNLQDYSDVISDKPDLPSKRKRKPTGSKDSTWDWLPDVGKRDWQPT